MKEALQDQVVHWRHAQPAFTGEFHEYARQLGVRDGKGTDYFEEELPQLLKDLAVDMQPQQRLDAIIVDEAQDFAPLWWEALLATTKDDAEIYAFLDDHQDVYRRWSNPSTGGASPLENLVTIHIDEHLRNTRKIAETFKSFAGYHFTPRGSTGLPVRRVQCATDDALDVAGDCIDALIDEGWANNRHRHADHEGPASRPPGLL